MYGPFLFKFFLYVVMANGPKDPWPCVLLLPGAQGEFVEDPTSLARYNIYITYLFVSYTLWDGCLWLTWKTLDSSSSPVCVSTVGSSGRACLAWCAAADSARVWGDSLLPSTETVTGNDPEISQSPQNPSHSTNTLVCLRGGQGLRSRYDRTDFTEAHRL